MENQLIEINLLLRWLISPMTAAEFLNIFKNVLASLLDIDINRPPDV